VEELEDEPDVPPPQRREPALADARHPLARDLHDARLRPVEPAEHMQQRRLARAGPAEHGDNLPGARVEVRAVQHPPRRATLAEGLHQPARGEHRHPVHGTAYAVAPAPGCRE
jgi:hypothetical protein